MTTDYVQRHSELTEGFRRMRESSDEVMSGFGQLHRAAMAGGVLTTRTKELIALAISITSHCDGCISFHVHDAIRAGATRAEVEETVGVAVLMGGGPAAVYGADALTALDQFEAQDN